MSSPYRTKLQHRLQKVIDALAKDKLDKANKELEKFIRNVPKQIAAGLDPLN
jgi:hypothetical protein